jgi:hypothetical protein
LYEARGSESERPGRSDLVEYLIVAVPDVDSVAALGPALAELVGNEAIVILDLVVVVKDRDGSVTVHEQDAVEGFAPLRQLGVRSGLLSEHDIGHVATALRPGTAGVVLVTEDRWAAPLSAAAHGVGGQILAGERIPSPRIESALAEHASDDTRGWCQ